MKRALTGKQAEIYEYIRSFIHAEGYPPTIREIADAFGYTSPRTVQVHLKCIEEKGWIRKRPGVSRGLDLMEVKDAAVPIVGRISAGSPLLAIENCEGELPFCFPRKAVDRRFALKVNGDSMINAGICNGDFCIVRVTADVRAGDVVVVVVGDEATVKRLVEVTSSRVVLAPENPRYSKMEYRSAEVKICGVVEGVWRDIR